jgi:NTE family protein
LFDGVFGGFSVEAGEMSQQLVSGNPTGLLKSGSLFVAADTPLGPAYLAYGRAQAGVSSYYFYLGKPF